MQFLESNGYLLVTDDQYPVVKLTQKSQDIFSGEPVFMKAAKEAKETGVKSEKSRKKPAEELLDTDYGLFEELRRVRMEIAKEERVPPYIVFSDKSLRDMSARKPKTEADFLKVNGVGENKCQKYGKKFLAAVAKWEAK